MSDTIGYVKGPLSTSGFDCTAVWSDASGFHRFYAMGFETKEQARQAAIEGAQDRGYIQPPIWKFWLPRLGLR